MDSEVLKEFNQKLQVHKDQGFKVSKVIEEIKEI